MYSPISLHGNLSMAKNLQMKWIIKKNAFDQFWQVQFIASNIGPSVVYLFFVVGCRSCPCNLLLRANMNNTQLRYRVRIIWNGLNINTVLKTLVHTRSHWKRKLYFERDPANLQPGQSMLIASTSQIKIHKQKESYLLFKVHRTTAGQSADIVSMIWMHENP